MNIKLYWWRGEGAQSSNKQNFGDYLSPLIVEAISGKKVEFAEPEVADMIAIGSILSRERKAKGWLIKRNLHIWGSGTDKSERAFSGRHYYHAVRGMKTRSQIKDLKQQPALGDPGLLADVLWEGRARPAKKFRLGVIPHFVDQTDPRVEQILAMEHTKFIDVFAPVDNVVNQILQCEFILSSSMHGLIIADSFGIPNRRMQLSSGKISDLKFDDYYSAFGIDSPVTVAPESLIREEWDHPVFTEGYQRPGLDQLKKQLTTSFPHL